MLEGREGGFSGRVHGAEDLGRQLQLTQDRRSAYKDEFVFE
jgi:hypothetical protein